MELPFRIVIFASICLYFAVAEVDRVLGVAHSIEKAELAHGFETRTIRDAKCSFSSDEQSIWSEIGEEARQVDTALNVVMNAGISTPALRKIAQHGVRVKEAGYINYSGLISSWAFWLHLSQSPWLHDWGIARSNVMYVPNDDYWWWPPMLWVAIWSILPIDYKAFTAKVLMKSFLALLLVAVPWQVALGFCPGHVDTRCAPIPGQRLPTGMVNDCSIARSFWPLFTFVQQVVFTVLQIVWFLCCMGPGRIASIPFCGSHFVEVVYTCRFCAKGAELR